MANRGVGWQDIRGKILTAHFSLYVHCSLCFFQFAKVLAEEMEQS